MQQTSSPAMKCAIWFLCLLGSWLPAVFAAFGVTTSGSSLIVDSGAGLVTTSKLNRLWNPVRVVDLFGAYSLNDRW